MEHLQHQDRQWRKYSSFPLSTGPNSTFGSTSSKTDRRSPPYFAKAADHLQNNIMIMVDDERLQVQATEEIMYPKSGFELWVVTLTGAVNSQATTVDEIIKELQLSKISERQGRAIDKDQIGSMETKKQKAILN